MADFLSEILSYGSFSECYIRAPIPVGRFDYYIVTELFDWTSWRITIRLGVLVLMVPSDCFLWAQSPILECIWTLVHGSYTDLQTKSPFYCPRSPVSYAARIISALIVERNIQEAFIIISYHLGYCLPWGKAWEVAACWIALRRRFWWGQDSEGANANHPTHMTGYFWQVDIIILLEAG